MTMAQDESSDDEGSSAGPGMNFFAEMMSKLGTGFNRGGPQKHSLQSW